MTRTLGGDCVPNTTCSRRSASLILDMVLPEEARFGAERSRDIWSAHYPGVHPPLSVTLVISSVVS
jgi:hypothetical protein